MDPSMSLSSMPTGAYRPPFVARHPIIIFSLLAATGAIAALPFATLLSALVAVWLGDTYLAPMLAADYAEGLGYLLGFYCLAMFPCGGAILGLLSGAIAYASRPIRDSQSNPLVPLVVGIVVATLVTLAVSVAAVFLLGR
jgi:hypothetical protein